MKRKKYYNFFLFFLSFFCFYFHSENLYSQEEVENKHKKKKPPEEIVINKNRYLKYTNWLTLGAGYGQKLNTPIHSIPGSLNVYFHVKKIYFNAGYMRSKLDILRGNYSEGFLSDLHGTVGFRNETRKSNFSYFAGPSYIHGLLDSSKTYSSIGAYAEIQYIKKIYYDVGIGSSVFINYNRFYPIVGIRLDIYFSNAFKGKIPEESLER